MPPETLRVSGATSVSRIPIPDRIATRSIWNWNETAPAAICDREDLVWTELTCRDRTFEFNRGVHIRVLKEDGGWAFESDDPELMGFGHTRSEAESSFCFGFAFKWDYIAIPLGNCTECIGCAESGVSRRRRGTERKAQPKTTPKIVNQ